MSGVDDVSVMRISDSLSDIESVDDTMQAGAAVATFSELEENGATDVMQSFTTPSDLGISVWGGRYVGRVVTILILNCNWQHFYYHHLSVLNQEIGWKERLWNDLLCVGWDIKP